MTPVSEYQRDTMPREVALEILTDPKQKPSSQIKRSAREARENHYPSTSPIVRIGGELFYTDTKPRSDTQTKRASRMSFKQLVHAFKRLPIEATQIEKALKKLGDKLPVRRDQLMARLQHIINWYAVVDTELAHRRWMTQNYPAHKKGLKILPWLTDRGL